ncbi:MAG: MFS transporter [Acidimicrobiia bacterium]
MARFETHLTADERTDERRFNLLWAGQAVSQFGDYLPYVSLPLFVKYLTDGTFEIALTYALDASPAVIVGFLGGVLVDRAKTRNLMVITDLLRAVAFAVLAWMAASDPEPGSGNGLVLVFAITFVAGMLAAFFNGALFAAVPRLVARHRLAVANARLSASMNLASILGPALAGVLISTVGFWPTFALNAVTFLVSAATVTMVGPIRSPVPAGAPERYWRAASSGLRHLWSDRRLRVATIGVAAVNFVTGFLEGTLVLTFDLIGAADEWQQGLLFTFMGAGALMGSVAAPKTIARLGNGRAMVMGTLGFGSLFAFFVNSSFGLVAFVLLLAAFSAVPLLSVAYATLRQELTPDELLGRVATASRAVAWTTLPIGALLGAAVSDLTDFGLVVRAAPVALVIIGLAMMRTVVWRAPG